MLSRELITIAFHVYTVNGNISVALFFFGARVVVNVSPTVSHTFDIGFFHAVFTTHVRFPAFFVVFVRVPGLIIGVLLVIGFRRKVVHFIHFIARSIDLFAIYNSGYPAFITGFEVRA
jgi:hypothetical protein